MTSRLGKRRITPSRTAALALAWAIVLVVITTCNGEDLSTPATWRFDCPKDSVLIQLVGTTTGGAESIHATITDIPLSEPVTDIPEYHDCQRFVEFGGYGSVYAIFAAFRLDKLSGGPVATIYTPNGTYTPLGIQAGFNCLFLTKTGASWTAKIVPWGVANNDCNDGHITVGPGVGKDLAVTMQNLTSGNFAGDDYPPVARWDWDSVHAQHYLGILCGHAWCEVGEPGFVPSQPYTGPALTFDPIPPPTGSSVAPLVLPPSAAARVQRIKGWYDVQFLGVLTGGSTQPTAIRGTLIPHPALDTINWTHYGPDPDASLNYYKDRWVHVGYAVMTGDYPKWNLKTGINKTSFCYGTLASCAVPTATSLEYADAEALTACPEDPTHNNLQWWAKTVSKVDPTGAPTASSTTTYSCIRRIDHRLHLLAWEADPAHANLSYRIPGAARWYFMPNDESTWHSCPTGCCSKL
jgi:hypothetical protein